MPGIIKMLELVGRPTPEPQPDGPQLIARINRRLVNARDNGASCIVLGPQDGFSLYHADRTPKPLSDVLVGALGELEDAGYVFVKSTTPQGAQALRVYFKAPPSKHRIELAELKHWPAGLPSWSAGDEE